MKVASVNLSNDKPDRQNNLAVSLYKLCVQLPAPNQEFYNIFEQLKSSSITKTPQEKVKLEPGGVVGDRHYMPDVKIKEDGAYYNLSSYKQVSLMSKNATLNLIIFITKMYKQANLERIFKSKDLHQSKKYRKVLYYS